MQILIVGIAGTLAAVAWVNSDGDELAAPEPRQRGVEATPGRGEARPQRRDAKGGQAPQQLNLARLDTRAIDDMKADLFATKSWYVPPPPPPPQPPPKPQPPPLPFKVIGRMLNDGETAVFVSNGDRNQALRVGDVVDGVWRVDTIDATRMTFTYLPLNETRFLALGAGH
jgi:hypothetical protein